MECGPNADAASTQVFESPMNDEEGHFDEFDRQLDSIKRRGPSDPALKSLNQPAK